MIQSDDFLLQLLWIRDFNSGLDIPFWPFVFLSNGFLKFQLQNLTQSYLLFCLFLVFILYKLISAIDFNNQVTRFVKLGISSALFLGLTCSQFKYFTFATYQFWSLLVSLSSSLLFFRAWRGGITGLQTASFSLLTLVALFTRFPQTIFVVIAFIATVINSQRVYRTEPKKVISRYILLTLTLIIILVYIDERQILNLYYFLSDSIALSTMPIERPFSNVLYTSLITIFPLHLAMLKRSRGFSILTTMSIIIPYNLYYFHFSRGLFENVAIALFFLFFATKFNASRDLLKKTLLLNILMSSFLFGSYNALRDFQASQIALCSLTIFHYYLSRQYEFSSYPTSQKANLLLSQVLAFSGILLLLIQFYNANRNEAHLSFNSVAFGKSRTDILFIDLTGRQDAWLLARDNRWPVFPYVIPAIFPSEKVQNQRVLAVANEVLEKRVTRVANIIQRIHKVNRIKILIEVEGFNEYKKHEISEYSSSLLSLLRFDMKLCEVPEKINQKNLPEHTVIIEACP